jgi:hypothetical protein
MLDVWLYISLHVVKSFVGGRIDTNAVNAVIEYVIGGVSVEHAVKLIP